jgi:UDP-2,3-diacylglucosamine hydrolase
LIAIREGKDWLFVSDAHFTGREPGEMESFLRFLDKEEARIDHLVILGDLFEFFFGFRETSSRKNAFSAQAPFVFPEYLPVLSRLQTLSQRGIRIKYFEGNHDFFLHSFFSEHLGMEVEVYPEGCEEKLGEMRAFISHGDLSNPEEWRYRLLRRTLKNAWMYRLVQLVGPQLTRRVARKLSGMSYDYFHGERSETPPPAFRAFAHQKFLEGFEVVILGHSHLPEEIEDHVDGKKCFYYNVGDWRVHQSFLRFTPPDQFTLQRFE